MPSLVALDNTLGALLIGVIISAMYVSDQYVIDGMKAHKVDRIYGMTVLQIYNYFSEYGRIDSKYLQLFVSALWSVFPSCTTSEGSEQVCRVFDTLHLALITRALYFYVITNFGDFFHIIEVCGPCSRPHALADDT